MAAPLGLCQGKRMTDKDKAERLAAKLRENLHKRKAQAREVERSATEAPAAKE